ncbi:MAG: hypothetical protein JWO52_2103 [Gammaproteobacteria bacterium]|jgi:hypothetical protein|nr:hypothetical protein [Gammaproteobacteria bacterium]
MKSITTLKTWSRMSRGALLASVGVLGLSQAPHALADTMLLSDTTLVRGTSSATFSFATPSAGTVTATVSNLPWPSSLKTLDFQATTASETISSWSALDSNQTGTESFAVGQGTYFAHIMAVAQGDLDLGLYSLNLTFSPNVVPLPTSNWMLLAGILVLFGLTRVMGMFGRFEAPRERLTPAL